MRNSINMHLVSWNVAHRTSRVTKQLNYLIGKSPDVIALQEVTPKYLNAILLNCMQD
jgi:exonuclease III